MFKQTRNQRTKRAMAFTAMQQITKANSQEYTLFIHVCCLNSMNITRNQRTKRGLSWPWPENTLTALTTRIEMIAGSEMPYCCAVLRIRALVNTVTLLISSGNLTEMAHRNSWFTMIYLWKMVIYYIALRKITIVNRKIHYKWAIFHSYVTNYQRVWWWWLSIQVVQ